MARHPEDAKDLVQETLLRAFRAFDQFVPGTNGKAWLFTILRSIFINRYRKSRREPQMVPVEGMEERFADEASRFAPQASPTVTDEEVEGALRDLSEEFRHAVWLVDIEELSYEEAARVLDCPVGTVRSRLFRGRKQLFLRLQDYARRAGHLKGA